MLERTQPSAMAMMVMVAATFVHDRAEAEQARVQALALHSQAGLLERRAVTLETRAAEAEAKLRKLESVAAVSEPASAALEPFALSPKETARIENCGTTLVYDRLKRGEYTAVRDGKNRTKITMESIRRRRAKLPIAVIAPVPSLAERRRRGKE
jgi:hypothetical protein